MAYALGRALLGRDVSRERKKLQKEETKLQREMEKQAEKQQKKGMWGSIGRTLGTVATGALLTPILGPGALLAAKMVGGYAGGRLGQGAIKASKKDIKGPSGDYTYLGEERRALGEAAKVGREDFDKATKGMREQLQFSSVVNPFMSFASTKGLEGIKELGSAGSFSADLYSKEGREAFRKHITSPSSLWEQLAEQPEVKAFYPKKED
jgi:hypothetical protein